MTITRQGTRLEQIIRERSNLPGLIIIPADASDDFGGLSFAFYRLSLPGLMIRSESLHLFKKETQILCSFLSTLARCWKEEADTPYAINSRLVIAFALSAALQNTL